MEPFAGYPSWLEHNPRCLRGSSCRTGYGLLLQQITRQTQCAYCGQSLIDTHEHWLLLSVDHVLPDYMKRHEGWREWVDNANNMVICCAGCNGFINGYRLPPETSAPTNFAEFVELRNWVFSGKKAHALDRLAREQEFYRSRPWEQEIDPKTLPRRP
jgi:hypothetical protein